MTDRNFQEDYNTTGKAHPMNDNEQTLIQALEYLDADDYHEWIIGGMALKHEGLPLFVWDGWSRKSNKYTEGECARRWATFNETNAGRPVTGGTLLMLAKQRGYLSTKGTYTPTTQRNTIKRPEKISDVLPTNYRPEKIPALPSEYDPAADMKKYLATLFNPADYVCYCDRLTEQTGKDGKVRYVPMQSVKDRTAEQLIEALNAGMDKAGICYQSKGGAFIRFNPMDGNGDGDLNVTDFRFCLIESDTDTLEKQYGLYKALNLPIAVLVHSGNKSLHAITHVDAQNIDEYRERVRFIYDYCKKHGLHVDEQDKNASRYSRLPGIKRGDNWQYIVAAHMGAKDFTEWKSSLTAQEAQQETKTDNAPPARNKVFAAIRQAHAKPNFEAAQEAERSEGEGLDLGIYFFRRRQETAEYNYFDDHGNEGGERLLFKKLTYIAARTGGGKTRFMCALAAQTLYTSSAQRPKHVIFFSLEEPAKDIEKHIVTSFLNLKHASRGVTITETETTAALLDKLTDEEKRDTIKSGYSDLADLLTVIDYESFEAAAAAAAEADNEHKDSYKGYHGDVAADIVDFILDAVADYGAENVVIFIDYAQMMKDPDGAKSAASYKELQGVARHLIRAAHSNAVLFVGAQVTREAVKSARSDKNRDPAANEFHSMTRENLREAADLEQSGARIIYLTIDYKNGAADDGAPLPFLNMRLLKNRYGTEHLYAAAPIHFDRWIIDFSKMTAPTLGDAAGNRGRLVDDKERPIQYNPGAAGTKPSGENTITSEDGATDDAAQTEQAAPSTPATKTDEAGRPYEAAASYAEAYYGPMGGATAGNSAPQKPFKPTRRKI